MANTLYKRIEIGIHLERARRFSHDPVYRTREALSKVLKISVKKLGDIENGHTEPDLRVAAEWCRLTGHYEVWEAITHIYKLQPSSVPPIHPDLNQRISDAYVVLQEEIQEGIEALGDIMKAWNKRRPGQPFDARGMLTAAKQIFDVHKAIDTFFMAAEREAGLCIEEVARVWTQDAIAKGIVMPKVDIEKELAMVR